MKTINLTKEQLNTIKAIEKLGFKKCDRFSGFEEELDGSFFYTFKAQHGMGVQFIQSDGSSQGNLLK